MRKVVGIDEAAGRVQDGMTVMIGGFLGVGTPEWLIDALLAKGVKDLTVIANDTAQPERGIGKLVVGRRVRKAVVSHIGTNPETGRQMNAGELEVRLVPQGTLVEQIRAGGAGLGGVLTHTGVGTLVEEGKAKIEIGGRIYLLELPLRADVALLKAHKGDTKGNLVYRLSARNFNPVIATAADWVIAEVERLVEPGEIDPDEVMTPGIFVDMVVERQVAENG